MNCGPLKRQRETETYKMHLCNVQPRLTAMKSVSTHKAYHELAKNSFVAYLCMFDLMLFPEEKYRFPEFQ